MQKDLATAFARSVIDDCAAAHDCAEKAGILFGNPASALGRRAQALFRDVHAPFVGKPAEDIADAVGIQARSVFCSGSNDLLALEPKYLAAAQFTPTTDPHHLMAVELVRDAVLSQHPGLDQRPEDPLWYGGVHIMTMHALKESYRRHALLQMLPHYPEDAPGQKFG